MGYGGEEDSIMTAAWPVAVEDERLDAWGVTRERADYVEKKHDLIRVGRILRADYDIAPSREIDYLVKPHSDSLAGQLVQDQASLKTLLRAASIKVDTALTPDKAMPTGVTQVGDIYMPLDGVVDVQAEIAKLGEQLEKIELDLERVNAKLDNIDFVSKAPDHVVGRQRARCQELLGQQEKIKRLTATLSSL